MVFVFARQQQLNLPHRVCVTVASRNEAKTKEVLSGLWDRSGNEDINSLIINLIRVAGVSRLAEEFKTLHDRLDVLTNNAGATFKEPKLGPDGVEITF